MARPADKFINRELSWIEFNQRVLNEALNPEIPLLERLNFLAITASNLDEFFMVRVGGLEMLDDARVRKRDPAGLTPQRQLEQVSTRVREMVEAQDRCYRDQLEPAMRKAGIQRVRPNDVTPLQSRYLESYFHDEVFPVVTPIAVTSAAEFPPLGNLRLHVMVRLKDETDLTKHLYAVIPIGPRMDRFVSLDSESGYAYITIEDVLRLFADRFFPGKDVVETIPFRITRNADIGVREDQAADFMALMQDVLDQRKRGDCVRLEIESVCSRTLLRFLVRALHVKPRNVYEVPGPVEFSAFSSLASMDGFDSLHYEPWQPQPSPQIDQRKSMFENITAQDILLYHPYDSFDPVVRFLEEAARDPDVLAIKQTLYRTSRDSPVINALRTAAEKGKYVTAVVELRARFDEARNIEWARELERAGAQVIYGVKGLKTHSKVCMVVRREPQGMVRYMHFGTGNYNEKTARLYADISYMTRDPGLGTDTSLFLNAVTGYSDPQQYLKLVAAPTGLREKLLELIDAETERKKQGQKAFIRAKMNSLVCPQLIKALYRASQAGVKIQLNVRGICCLRPGVKGLSHNITVISIVDRFLEHARIFHFYHGGDEEVFISSADWMPRNLDRRVELAVPVEDSASRDALFALLDVHFDDRVKGSFLQANGSYRGKSAGRGKPAIQSQRFLCKRAVAAIKASEAERPTVFEPYRTTGNEPS